jgi:hypothetical protein
LVNFVPIVGVLSAEALSRAYGIDLPRGDLLILMRHRALLFGIIGALIVSSAFLRHLQVAAMSAGLASMVGFLILALSVGGYGAKIQGVVVVDVVATVLLVIAIVLRASSSSGT